MASGITVTLLLSCSSDSVHIARNGYFTSWFETLSYPPTTSQSVFPLADQRLPVTEVCILRRSCGGNRRTPLTGESERVLPQRGTFHRCDGTRRNSFEIGRASCRERV